MDDENVYSRKISRTEAKKGFIFILKNKLSFFPPIGDNFELVNDGVSKGVKVESYPCTCRGPERPHEHYFIRWESLEAGNKVEITKESKCEYNLKIQH